MQLISVIIPCHNYGWIIHETLDSLVKQTYVHWEGIIVDDGSVDNTRAVLQDYVAIDKRFKYIYQEAQGVSSARNTGLANASGSLIQFLDADDLLEPDKFYKQAAYLSSNAAIDIIYGEAYYFRHGQPTLLSNSFGMQDESKSHVMQGTGSALLPDLLEKNPLVINAPLLKMEVIKKVGIFSTNLPAMEDWEFWLRCALADISISYMNAPGTAALVRVHSASASQHRPKMTHYELHVRTGLRSSLLKLNDKRLYDINEVGIENQMARIAAYNTSEADFLRGIGNFVELSWYSGKYVYYLKSLAYWLRKRFSK